MFECLKITEELKECYFDCLDCPKVASFFWFLLSSPLDRDSHFLTDPILSAFQLWFYYFKIEDFLAGWVTDNLTSLHIPHIFAENFKAVILLILTRYSSN